MESYRSEFSKKMHVKNLHDSRTNGTDKEDIISDSSSDNISVPEVRLELYTVSAVLLVGVPQSNVLIFLSTFARILCYFAGCRYFLISARVFGVSSAD